MDLLIVVGQYMGMTSLDKGCMDVQEPSIPNKVDILILHLEIIDSQFSSPTSFGNLAPMGKNKLIGATGDVLNVLFRVIFGILMESFT